jgi:hypothetical protein
MIALLLIAAVVEPAASPPPATCAHPAAANASAKNLRSVEIVGDWQPDRDAAWTNARRKAFATACRPYRVVGSAIAVKGPQRRVKLRIEWNE